MNKKNLILISGIVGVYILYMLYKKKKTNMDVSSATTSVVPVDQSSVATPPIVAFNPILGIQQPVLTTTETTNTLSPNLIKPADVLDTVVVDCLVAPCTPNKNALPKQDYVQA